MKYERFLLGLNKNGETVQYCVDLKQLNSFGIGGKTKYLVVANKAKTIKEIAKYTKLFYIVGNGTNIVFPDKLYKGTIIKLGKNFSTIKVKNNKVVAGASANLFALNNFLKDKELSGLEFTFGIPGSVGGAVFMNAGAFGDEIGNYVTRVKIFDGEKIYWTKNFTFSYRNSTFKQKKYVILFVELTLSKGKKEEIEKRQKEFLEKRKTTQPYGEKSAGSVFKRIEKNGKTFFPAKIIDKLGLKGVKIGSAEISTKHAGFIVNKNSATQKDVKKLIKKVKNKIKRETGFELEEEIILLKGDTKWLS